MKEIVLNSLEVHQLFLNKTILVQMLNCYNKSYVSQGEEIKLSLYLHFFRAQSQRFIDGKSEGDSLQNSQSTEDTRLGTSVSSHLKTSPVACSYKVPGNTGKKQITVVPLYFSNSFFCVALE